MVVPAPASGSFTCPAGSSTITVTIDPKEFGGHTLYLPFGEREHMLHVMLRTPRSRAYGDKVYVPRTPSQVAPLRPDIRAKLEEMYNSPISPLRNHPQLLRVLEAVDRAEAEKKQIKADTNGEHRNDESDE